jgi:hypothetical protein
MVQHCGIQDFVHSTLGVTNNENEYLVDQLTIPGLEDVAFQNEWKLFRKNKNKNPEPDEKRFRDQVQRGSMIVKR